MLLSTLACSWCWLLPVVTAQAASSSISSLRRSSRRSAAIENQYFVLLKTHKPSRSLEHLLQRRRLSHDTSIKEGLLRTVQNLQEEDLVILLNHDEVAFVEQVGGIQPASTGPTPHVSVGSVHFLGIIRIVVPIMGIRSTGPRTQEPGP